MRKKELKNKIAADFFAGYDCTRSIGNVDFCVSLWRDTASILPPADFLWAKVRTGNRCDVLELVVQLVLSIGKARTFAGHLPPSFLAAFNAEKIVFLPWHRVLPVFSQNDFNWNAAPSDHNTKEFCQLYALIHDSAEKFMLLFSFSADADSLREFISTNFCINNSESTKIAITRNNFTCIYHEWIRQVKPNLAVSIKKANTANIPDAIFYLADLISHDNLDLQNSLDMLLKSMHYEFDSIHNSLVGDYIQYAELSKSQAYTQFWNKYERPTRAEFRNYILQHRNLLVPQNVRESRGSYFTPKQWVILSQQYLADVLGEKWQDEYYIWDCAAGTGNLLAGLVNKERIWASTLDQTDVDIMQGRIASDANLLPDHIFRFDFLNDAFSGCPDALQKILHNPAERKKLVLYFNPPYAEASNSKCMFGEKSRNKPGVSRSGKYTYEKYKSILGRGINEIYVQFLVRIFTEIHGCYIANFSTLKILQGENFTKFRDFFTPKLQSMFMVPAWTFDNVSGKFPIGFYIWNTSITEKNRKNFSADVYNAEGKLLENKDIFCPEKGKRIMQWLQHHYDKNSPRIAYLERGGSDFQSNDVIFITLAPSKAAFENSIISDITVCNLRENAIFNTVRHIISVTWINHNDQFLYPASSWHDDTLFQNDCLAWTLFHNNVSVMHGINHWIPFTEEEVHARGRFASHFMTEYMQGKLNKTGNADLLQSSSIPSAPLQFAPEAKAVFDAGRELWRYYQSMPDANPDAAFYDIRAYFQGRNAAGRMKARSPDAKYTELLANLRTRLKILAEKIVPRVYAHGFLKK